MIRRVGVSFWGMAVGLLFVVLGARALLMEAQSDTFWTLRAGQDLWATGCVPSVDTYSYTVAGLPWPDHEWLWQAFVYPLHRAGGMPLLALGVAIPVVWAVALAYRVMVGTAGTRFALLLPAIALMSFTLVLRPQVVTMVFLVVLVWALARERFVVLPFLFLVWANTHGGVALGGLLLGVAFVTALVRARVRHDPVEARRARWLAVMLALCALATAATPMGFGIFRFVVESEGRLRSAHIAEWLPTLPDLSIGGAFWIIALAYAGLLAWRVRTLRQASWADWVAVACATALLPLAFRSVRHVGPFLLLAPIAASRLLGAEFQWRRRVSRASEDHPLFNAALLGIFAVGAAAAVLVAWSQPVKALGWRPLPEGVLSAIRACPGRLYNHYNQGGYLIWLTPETKVFIDNRQDPYPLPFLLDHVRIEAGALPWEPTFRRWNIQCSFLSVDSPTVTALQKAGWRDAYRDEKWAVQVAP